MTSPEGVILKTVPRSEAPPSSVTPHPPRGQSKRPPSGRFEPSGRGQKDEYGQGTPSARFDADDDTNRQKREENLRRIGPIARGVSEKALPRKNDREAEKRPDTPDLQALEH